MAIMELHLCCAATYTHPLCWQAAPILAHPTHAHIPLETPWIATRVGTIDMYVFQAFQNRPWHGRNRWHRVDMSMTMYFFRQRLYNDYGDFFTTTPPFLYFRK